jgi:hypothetical protein
MSTEYASIAQICPVRAEISDNIPLILIAKKLLDDATAAVQVVEIYVKKMFHHIS